MSSKAAVLIMLGIGAGFMGGYMSCKPEPAGLIVEKWTDTVVIREPEVMVIRKLVSDTVFLAVAEADSVAADSVRVVVPREQKEYHGEGYRAWVSGYRPALDSIMIERMVLREKARRWSVGLQAGIGMTPRGVQPYIGVGVSIKIF